MLRAVVVEVASSFMRSVDELTDKQRYDTESFKTATSEASSFRDLLVKDNSVESGLMTQCGQQKGESEDEADAK